MNKITKASTIMQSESSEEPIEQPNPEETPQFNQPTESQIQKPKLPEGQPLPPNERVNTAYKLVYGEDAKMPPKDEAITQPDDEWFIRSFFGALFATPNDNPLTQKFSNLDELLTWFYQTYPAQQQEEQSE